MMPIDDWNRMAVQGLLADTARVLALTDLDAVRGDREIVDDAIANAQKNYIGSGETPQATHAGRRRRSEIPECHGSHPGPYALFRESCLATS
jgi:hypothetical protein